VIPGSFDYHSPATVDDAVALLDRLGGEGKVLAGGHSLVPAMRFRLAAPAALIDINRIVGLSYIRVQNDHLVIGALTREAEIERAQIVHEKFGALADASRVIADPIVRNRGTIGGNLAHADPANDHPAVMLAYGAEIVAKGPGGQRVIPVDEFFVGLFASALAPNELLIEVRVPMPGPGQGSAYLKLERKVGDYAISAVAANITMDGDVCSAARIGLTNVGAVPMRARQAEAALTGKRIDDGTLEAAGQAAAGECDPSPDLRGSIEYKRDVTRVLLKRAVRRAMIRAKGGAA
jgi:carbon-monoxide dehydrogenase medium subunit